MSLENFCNRYPANPEVRGIVENRRRTEGQYGKSLVVILAEQLAREGRDGVREIINKLSGSNTMFRLEQESFQRLPAQDRSNLFRNYEAIVFGNVVVSIEKTLANGEYDHEDFCERYNLDTSGFQLDKAEAGTKKREKLSREQMSRIYLTAGTDKTLAGFLEGEDVGALPSALREFLESRGLLNAIRENILPIYKPRAKFVVA